MTAAEGLLRSALAEGGMQVPDQPDRLYQIARQISVQRGRRPTSALALAARAYALSYDSQTAFARALKLRAGFDPDEPRDEQGRWTEGGDGGHEGETSVPHEPLSHDVIQQHIDRVSETLGFDKSKVKISDDTRTFMLNGRQYNSAGTADIASIRAIRERAPVTIYARHVHPDTVAGVIAHEIEHVKFQHALDKHQDEWEQIKKEPGPPPNPNSEHWWERQGGFGAVMRPDGTLWPPYDAKYPNYQAVEKALKMPGPGEFAKADGVSDYSHEYWKGWKDKTISSDLATHETLAEMSRIKHETGKYPEHMGERLLGYRGEDTPKPTKEQIAQNAKLWRDLHRAVEGVWKRTSKP